MLLFGLPMACTIYVETPKLHQIGEHKRRAILFPKLALTTPRGKNGDPS